MDKKDGLPATKAAIKRLDGKLDRLGRRLAGHDRRFSTLDQKFSSIDRKFTAIDQKFSTIEQKFSGIDRKFSALDRKIDDSTHRLALEIVKTNAHVEDFKDEILRSVRENTDRILCMLDRCTRTSDANNAAVTVHGAMLTEHRDAVRDPDRRISRLESSRPGP